MTALLTSWSPRILSVLRIITGFLILWHGSQKLFDFPSSGKPAGELTALMMTAGIIELFGGLLILIGFLTRPVAFLLSGLLAVAYFMAHAPGGFLPLTNRGELAVLYCFVFFYLFFAGGGPWSVDALIGRNKVEQE
jgi:putative oxidoreductase